MSDAPLVFIHVPKTGGSTVCAIARRQYAAEAIAGLPGSLDAAHAALLAQPAAVRARLRFLHGHVPFGVHAALPGGARYMTFLRHPVARLFSVYHFALRRPEWGLHRVLHERGLSFEQFIASEIAAEFHDAQTRMLAGRDGAVTTNDMLAPALAHLTQDVTVVGITERFAESLLVCRQRLGWQRLYHRRANVNRHRPALAGIAPHVVRLIERRNALDLELHAAGERLLDAALDAGGIDAAALRRFRAVNRVYAALGTAVAGAAAVRRIAARVVTRSRPVDGTR